MADEVKPSVVDPGARVPKGTIDPDLVKLARTRLKIGVITCAALVALCGYFVVRLGPDRRFGSAGDKAEVVSAADVVAGKVGLDRFISLDAEPMMSHAIRAVTTRGREGLRVAPIRGSGERLWLVTSGDGNQSSAPRYIGRLRKLADLPFAVAVRDFIDTNPRPVFATPAAVRSGIAANKVTTVGGDTVELTAADAVAFDVVDPGAATIVAAYTDKLPDAAAWSAKLTAIGAITSPATSTGPSEADGVRFTSAMPDAVATIGKKLEDANLWAARVDPVTRHYQTTWGAIAKASATGYVVDGVTIPDAQLDLVGLYVARGIPDDAYVLLDGERPDDYWYVLPITVGLGVIGLLFAWALARAVRRDLLPPRA